MQFYSNDFQNHRHKTDYFHAKCEPHKTQVEGEKTSITASTNRAVKGIATDASPPSYIGGFITVAFF